MSLTSVSAISEIKPYIGFTNTNGEGVNKGTLRGITTREVQHTSTELITTPVDLTADGLRNIGVDTPVAQLQKGVVRLRVELNGESIGAGSGFVISSDGLILSVNHVPALGQKAGFKPADFISGTDVLKNMQTWHELLGQKGETRLVADFPLLPKPNPPQTILTPGQGTKGSPIKSIFESIFEKDQSKGATAYGRYDDTIEVLTVPLKIIAQIPGQDLMLAKIDLPEAKDPYPRVRLTDTLPNAGDLVYSIGHPHAIKHNALALGEVLDPSFDVNKIKRAVEAHGVVFKGIANAIGSKGGSNDKEFLSTVARLISLQCAGIDVEPLVNFMNGAVITTNNIAPGSSGGLLVNGNGEAIGITYLGLLMPFNRTPIIRYAAGALDFHTKELPLSHISGSVGMKKAIPFLEQQGINIAKINDGEPADVNGIAKRAVRVNAREAMAVFLIGQGVKDTALEERLKELGLGEEKVEKKEADTPSQTTSQYKIGDVSLSSKPTEVLEASVKGDNDDLSKAKNIIITVKFATEAKPAPEGETITLTVNPTSFNLDTFADEHTKSLVISHLLSEPENTTLKKLQELQTQIESNGKEPPDDNPPTPPSNPNSGLKLVA